MACCLWNTSSPGTFDFWTQRRDMPPHIQHAGEPRGNADRESLVRFEPRALRTFTPTQADIATSAGVFHSTPDGRRLYDFTSGVLVSNLGHNPTRWMNRFARYMKWPDGWIPRHTRLYRRGADDGVQRRDTGRGRGVPAADETAARLARRRTTGAGDVGRVRLGGDPEGSLGGAGPRPDAADDHCNALSAFTARRDSPTRSPAARPTASAIHACASSRSR